MPESTPVFPTLRMYTHMPFFAEAWLLFCGSEHIAQQEFRNRGDITRRMVHDKRLREHFADLPLTSRVSFRQWKLHYSSWPAGQPRRLQTGLPADFTECSPSMYQDGPQIFVSFIGGTVSDRALNYNLYTMQGASLDSLSAATCVVPTPAVFGFVSQKYICVSRGREISLTDRRTRSQLILSCSLRRIVRVTYRADNSDIFLITGLGADNAAKTLQYDLSSKTTNELYAAAPVYKSSVLGDRLIVAVGADKEAESYRLVSSSYTLIDSKETVLVA